MVSAHCDNINAIRLRPGTDGMIEMLILLRLLKNDVFSIVLDFSSFRGAAGGCADNARRKWNTVTEKR